MARRSDLVDYAQAASHYDAGRALLPETFARWGAAVARVAPARDAVVADLGAGTGLFVGAWLDWGARRVLAIEPSRAMRERGARQRIADVAWIAGDATAMPLRDGAVDIVWMSAVLHHVADHARCARELARVLRPGGRLLLRSFFPDRSRLPWLPWLPGAERARARFPSASALRPLLEAAQLHLVDAFEVEDARRPTRAEAADWIEQMRESDSVLTSQTPQEIDAAIARLREAPAEVLEPNALSLLAFERRSARD